MKWAKKELLSQVCTFYGSENAYIIRSVSVHLLFHLPIDKAAIHPVLEITLPHNFICRSTLSE
jgi:hypothetical protein